MCTRYYIDSEDPILAPIIQEIKQSPLYNKFIINQGHAVTTDGEVFPTDIVPILAPDRHGNRAAFPMRWGFHLADGKPLFNARSETAAVKPFFREDWERHRCIIPASYYFEWSREAKRKENPEEISSGNPLLRKAALQKAEPGKYMIQTPGSTVTWMCGLYRIDDGYPYFVVLTREPSEDLRRIHDRMPLILPESMAEKWIRPETDPSKMLDWAITEMVWESA